MLTFETVPTILHSSKRDKFPTIVTSNRLLFVNEYGELSMPPPIKG